MFSVGVRTLEIVRNLKLTHGLEQTVQLVVQYGQLGLVRFEIEIDQVLLLDRVHLVDLSQGQQAALNFVDLWWMERTEERKLLAI